MRSVSTVLVVQLLGASALQGRMIAAVVLVVLHLGAFVTADDVIMREIPGSHPYLTGLGILGGIYSFTNPLEGTMGMVLVSLALFENLD